MRSGTSGTEAAAVVEHDYWALVMDRVGTVEACRRVGIGRKPGYQWRAERGALPPLRSPEAERGDRYLSLIERKRIATLRERGHGVREIARRVKRRRERLAGLQPREISSRSAIDRRSGDEGTFGGAGRITPADSSSVATVEYARPDSSEILFVVVTRPVQLPDPRPVVLVEMLVAHQSPPPPWATPGTHDGQGACPSGRLPVGRSRGVQAGSCAVRGVRWVTARPQQGDQMRPRILLVVTLAAVLPLTACGDDDDTPADTAVKTGTTMRPTSGNTGTETTGLRGEGVESELTTGSEAPPATDLRGPGLSTLGSD